MNLRRITAMTSGLLLSAAVLVLSSCSTMEALEKQRKARLAQQKKEVQQEKQAIKNGDKPDFSNETGSLFQPKVKSLKFDQKTADLQKSVDKADQSIKSNDLAQTQNVATGPVSIKFKNVLQSAQDLELMGTAYRVFAEASLDVLESIHAYGLAKNLKAIEQVRKVRKEWEVWFTVMKIEPKGQGIDTKTVSAFFDSIGASQAVFDSAIEGMNVFIDRQRTRAWAPTPAPQPAARTGSPESPALAPPASPSPPASPAPSPAPTSSGR